MRPGLLLFALLLLASAAEAQAPSWSLDPEPEHGARVRVFAPELRPDRFTALMIRVSGGEALSLSERVGGMEEVRRIPLAAVERLEVAAGRRRGRAGLIGAAVGAALLGGHEALSQRGSRDGCRPECQVLDLEQGLSIAAGAILGGAAGALLLAPTRWVVVSITPPR